MELHRLIEALSDPAAYPETAGPVELLQTHISAVFLTGSHAYKIKKPVNLGFLDFTTLAKRRHFCAEEVRLNRRLAADVYLGVVPITDAGGGQLSVEGDGPVVEWAVKMQRLPDQTTLEHRLAQDENVDALIDALAEKIATFHAGADRGEHVAAFGRYEVVEHNALENFEQAASQIGAAISRPVFERLQALTIEALAACRSTIESRAAHGVPCDTHGDLRPGHVYLLPDPSPPGNLVVIDCIEFNERFRFADPVSDMAFLVMGLARAGHAELASRFADAYFRLAGDGEGRRLLPFYVSYRAAVRGKVDGMQATDTEISDTQQKIALSKARGFWLSALGALEAAHRRPCLLLVGGLPGTGKSTLSALLAERAGFEVIRSDVVRKELAGQRLASQQPQGFGQGIYAPQWTEKTFAECLRRAERLLFEGRRVVIDASFRNNVLRNMFFDAAIRWGVPPLFIVCQAEADVIQERLANRTGDVSDADWSIYQQAANAWQPPSRLVRRAMVTLDTTGSPEQSLAVAIDVLRERALF